MSESEHEAAVEEADIVWKHRCDRFEELGFNRFQAQALADAAIDWHLAERLIKLGCSFETAVDLLL